MNDFLKRVERVKAALVGRQPSGVTWSMWTVPNTLWAFWRL